jgi:caffeoyl-CoA O-methyltransferase
LEIVNNIAGLYAEQHSTEQSALLHQIEQFTTANHPKQHMLSGSLQGRLLSAISKIIRPTYILEIGTFTGFSALCLAEGLAPEGQLHTIESREEDAATAQSFFDKSPFSNQIKLHVANALDVIPTLKLEWDLIFLDADKVNYLNYYELTLPYLKKGGVMLADNVLFHGQVLDENIKGKNAIAIDAFNKTIKADSSVEVTMLTIRDGISMIRKL